MGNSKNKIFAILMTIFVISANGALGQKKGTNIILILTNEQAG